MTVASRGASLALVWLLRALVVLIAATSCKLNWAVARAAPLASGLHLRHSCTRVPCRGGGSLSEDGSHCASLIGQLSRLPPHLSRDASLEQYATDVEVAAFWLDAIDRKEPFSSCQAVVDLGAGNGALGIGALLLGAPRVIFVEVDPVACEALLAGLRAFDLASRAEVLCVDVSSIKSALQECDVVIMNPPWGQRRRFADRPFLEAAVDLARNSVHLLHSAGARHVEPWARDAGWDAARWLEAELTLPYSYAHQRKNRAYVDAAMWWLQKRDGARTARQDLPRSEFVISARSRWAKLARSAGSGASVARE